MDTKFLYRFRPLARLFGKDYSPGELEKREIYFASPEQLNDPLEGYKDLVWKGDEVKWRNLYRHYSTCVIQHCVVYTLSGQTTDVYREILIHNYPENLSPKLAAVVNSVNEELLETPEMKEYISAVSQTKRKIRAPELTIHLRVIHRYTLAIAFKHLVRANACDSIHEKIFARNNVEYLDHLRALAQTLKEANDQEIFDEALQSVSLELDEARILTTQRGLPQQLFFLTIEFPDEFCKALESLTYPNWYTACFMSECTNSSLWGTYGENHKGVCLKFKIETDGDQESLELDAVVGFSLRGNVRGKVRHNFYPIDYERAFVEIDFFNSIGTLPVPVLNKYWLSEHNRNIEYIGPDLDDEWRQGYWKNFIEAVTVKLREWRFENEYRLIVSPMVTDLTSSDDRKANYEFESLDGIIFGIKTSMEVKLEIIKTIESMCISHDRKDFNFYQARYDPRSKKILHDKLNILNFRRSDSPS